MITRQLVIKEAIKKCLNEMYKRSQPKISLSQMAKLAKQDPYIKFYEQHYLSQEEYHYIMEKYVKAYNIESHWNGYIGIVKDYVKDHVKDHGININDVDKVLECIKDCKEFYRFNHEEALFKLSIANYSPTSNKELVEKYYESIGEPIVIHDRVFNEETEQYEYK